MDQTDQPRCERKIQKSPHFGGRAAQKGARPPKSKVVSGRGLSLRRHDEGPKGGRTRRGEEEWDGVGGFLAKWPLTKFRLREI